MLSALVDMSWVTEKWSKRWF